MKILVVHASAGAGHLKAAEAVRDGLKKYTSHEVTLTDALDLNGPRFKNLYRKGYFFLVSRVPWLWKTAFYILDVPCLQPLIRLARRLYNTVNCAGVRKYLVREQFDVMITTHFMPNEIASALKRRGMIRTKLITAVTDYDVHRIWLGSHVDLYAVACDWTGEKLKKLGIPPEKVVVTGIPTNERFSEPCDAGALKNEWGLADDKLAVLIATGSFGIGPIERIIQELGEDFQVMVVCGHGKTLFKRLTDKAYPWVKVFGLVDNMHEIMAAADVMITKPGGLSVSEALVRSLPMIFFSSIPGQETRNVMVLKEYGIGISQCSAAEIAAHLRNYRNSPEEFSAAVEKTKSLARPEAVKDIVGLIN